MNMDAEFVTVTAVAILAIVMVAFAAFRGTTQRVTVETVTDALSDIELAAGAAREWVLAAEQLWLTGQLEKDKRFYYVLERLKTVYPHIDEDTLEGSIEAGVRWMRLLGSGASLEG